MYRLTNWMNEFYSVTILGIAVLSLLFTFEARAEDINQYLANLPKFSLGAGGALNVPTEVYQGLSSGAVSPIMQYVLANSMMDQCAKQVMEDYILRRDPYQLASAKFKKNITCKLTACFNQAFMGMLLPTLSGVQQNGGLGDETLKQKSSQLMLILLSTMQQQPGCDGKTGSAVPQGLAQAINQGQTGPQ